MSSIEVISRPRATEMKRVEPLADPDEAYFLEEATCECGFPGRRCAHFCSIDDLDWFVY